jgi:SAM-dependent methyltransferase
VDAPADGTYVDLGAGSGTFLAKLRQRLPKARLVGVELHPEMADLARANLGDPDIRILDADLAVPLPLEAESVDVVSSSLTLHELPHPPDLLANAARILRPGGQLVLFDIVKWPLSTYMQGRELDRDALDHFREHCLFTPDDLAWLVRHAGFEVQEVIGRNDGRFAMVIARKP